MSDIKAVNQVNVPTRAEVDGQAQAVFDQLEKGLGRVPNLFALIGHSGNALASFMTFSGAQAKGAFNAKEREAIYLAVSQANGCDYCLAAHTAIGKLSGFTEEDTLKLRAGTIENEKLRVLTQLATAIVANAGKADPALVDAFYGLGYSHAALIDLVALVADKTFTNYVARLTNVPVDFPAAPAL